MEEGRSVFLPAEGLPFLGEVVLEAFRWGEREVHLLLGLGSRGRCERGAESREEEGAARDLGGGEPDRPDGGRPESGSSRITFLS